MKKIITLMICLTMILHLSDASKSYAAEFQGTGEILFSAESVNNTDFKVISGNIGDRTISVKNDFSNFVLETDITIKEHEDTFGKYTAHGGVLFRVNEEETENGKDYGSYYFGLDILQQRVMLGHLTGNSWNEIASKKMTLEYDKIYHISIIVEGQHIICYVDYDGTNYAKIDVLDEEYSSGGIGMFHYLMHSDYKNIIVNDYNENMVSEEQSYTNPVLDECADPDILYHKGIYYLYCTTPTEEGNKGIKVYTSTDLVNWTAEGFAFTKGDGWGTFGFWAPDIIERDGIFYMYYTANEHLCVATSDSPLGPFTQDVHEPMHKNIKEIDAHAFYDEVSDKYYFYFVRFTGGNVIWGAELNDDMKTINEDTLVRLLVPNQGWDQDMAEVNEGPYMLVHDGKYYLTYSGSHFESINYGSGYAVADSPLGPYTKYENNPIMKSNSAVHGTGHHCITTSPDGTEMFMVYHCHNSLSTTDPRKLCIDRIQFTMDANKNTVLEVKGPTITPQPLPSGAGNGILDKKSVGYKWIGIVGAAVAVLTIIGIFVQCFKNKKK